MIWSCEGLLQQREWKVGSIQEPGERLFTSQEELRSMERVQAAEYSFRKKIRCMLHNTYCITLRNSYLSLGLNMGKSSNI
jgi:hypothetical protein